MGHGKAFSRELCEQIATFQITLSGASVMAQWAKIPLRMPALRIGGPGSSCGYCALLTQLPANSPARQHVTAQILGFLLLI